MGLTSDVSNIKESQGSEAWSQNKECVKTTTTTTTTTTTSHDCWSFEQEKNFDQSGKIDCSTVDSTVFAASQVDRTKCKKDDGSLRDVTREQCKKLCSETVNCAGFALVHQGDKNKANDVCYLTSDVSGITECEGSEAWSQINECVKTTTTTTT